MIWIIFLVIVLVCFMIYWLFASPYSQIFGKFPYKVKTNKKIIALTFDDGPNEPYTSELIDYLDSKNIKATFFEVGKCVQRHPNITKKIFLKGHTIGVHTLSHEFHKNFIDPKLKAEIIESRKIIKDIIHKEPALFRPPWLWRTPILFKQLKSMNLQPVSGEFCSSIEVFQPNAKLIAKHTLSKAKPGSIIIFHDGYNSKGAYRQQTIDAVKIVVESLQKNGYSFVTVDELLGIKPYN